MNLTALFWRTYPISTDPSYWYEGWNLTSILQPARAAVCKWLGLWGIVFSPAGNPLGVYFRTVPMKAK